MGGVFPESPAKKQGSEICELGWDGDTLVALVSAVPRDLALGAVLLAQVLHLNLNLNFVHVLPQNRHFLTQDDVLFQQIRDIVASGPELAGRGFVMFIWNYFFSLPCSKDSHLYVFLLISTLEISEYYFYS